MTIPACIISQGKMLFITEYSDWSCMKRLCCEKSGKNLMVIAAKLGHVGQ